MPPLLVATDVSVQPLGAPAPILAAFSLILAAGEQVLLLGDSGSGKTTALRCLNGLTATTTGSIQLAGRAITEIEPRELRRRVGMIAQTPYMFDGTVADNLMLAARYAGRAIDAQDHIHVVQRAGLSPDLIDRAATSLSVGQQQRVAIARVLIGRPQIILCDEPTSALDEAATVTLEETIIDLQTSGTAIVFVTHDMHQAARLGGRIMRLVDGLTVPSETVEQ